MYRVQGRKNAGYIPAGSVAAEMMRASTSPEVRRLQREAGKRVERGSEAARRASEAARGLRIYETDGGPCTVPLTGVAWSS